jgi:hypothetical protein
MPKQNYEIKTFTQGILASPQDNLDIPDNAAVYSLNIDPLTDGALGGIPDDMLLKGSGFTTDISSISYTQGGVTGGSSGSAGPPPLSGE